MISRRSRPVPSTPACQDRPDPSGRRAAPRRVRRLGVKPGSPESRRRGDHRLAARLAPTHPTQRALAIASSLVSCWLSSLCQHPAAAAPCRTSARSASLTRRSPSRHAWSSRARPRDIDEYLLPTGSAVSSACASTLPFAQGHPVDGRSFSRTSVRRGAAHPAGTPGTARGAPVGPRRSRCRGASSRTTVLPLSGSHLVRTW
jgi:hypothetical protein